MSYYTMVSGESLDRYISNYDVLICSIRSSRRKAKHLAIAEMFFVLSEIGCIFIVNGPLGDRKGIISFFVTRTNEDVLRNVLRTSGYCDEFYLLDFSKQLNLISGKRSNNQYIWKGKRFDVKPFFKQCRKTYEEHSPHNREFFIYNSEGVIKSVIGYRGDGTSTGRRALPVEDSRLMINLAIPHKAKILMDPFAGSGGILHSARYINPSLFLISSDIDPVLEPGLRKYSDIHFTMDARKVNLDSRNIDAIVTEIPFCESATDIVAEAFVHLSDFLNDKSRIIFMCADYQYKQLNKCLKELNFNCFMERPVNRKGTQVVISAWFKAQEMHVLLHDFSMAISKVY